MYSSIESTDCLDYIFSNKMFIVEGEDEGDRLLFTLTLTLKKSIISGSWTAVDFLLNTCFHNSIGF